MRRSERRSGSAKAARRSGSAMRIGSAQAGRPSSRKELSDSRRLMSKVRGIDWPKTRAPFAFSSSSAASESDHSELALECTIGAIVHMSPVAREISAIS